MRSLLSTVLFSSSLLVSACSTTNDPAADSESSAEVAVDSAESTSAEGNMMMAAIVGADLASAGSGLTSAAVSAKLAANVSARFTPSGCATVAPDGAALKAVFRDCTGPGGLIHVTGELDLTVSISLEGAIAVKGTSSDLQVNGAHLDIDATGTYSTTGTRHTLMVTTSGTGTGPRGNVVGHDGDYTIHWDPANQCRSIEGQWSTESGDHTRPTTVDLSQCGGGCPTGSIARTLVDGKKLTVSFDGTATASWSVVASATAGSAAGSASGTAGASVISSGTVSLDCN